MTGTRLAKMTRRALMIGWLGLITQTTCTFAQEIPNVKHLKRYVHSTTQFLPLVQYFQSNIRFKMFLVQISCE